MMLETIELTLPRQKTIALIAHDNKKPQLLAWVKANRERLAKHSLCGTGTTARIIADETDLPVCAYNSWPLGGDQQIGARIAEGKIDCVIFFWDPLTAQPHDPDVKALLRIALVYDIPIANNPATADFMIQSPLMEAEYPRAIRNFTAETANRAAEFAKGAQP